MASAALLQSLLGSQKPKDLYTSMLIKQGLSTEPVGHWTQGASRIVQALLGAQALRDDEQQSEAALQARMNAPGLGGGGPAPAPQPGIIPRLAQTLMGGSAQQQPEQPPPQPNLGPVTSGPRPAHAPPAYAEPRGIRNNNQLNIESGRFAQAQPGFSGSDGRFARFEQPQQGLDAASNLLASYGQRGINTVAGVINRWAPASDGNPVSAYANTVAKAMGVGPNDPINLADPATRQKLVMAMGQFENGRPIQMAQAGGPQAMPQSPNQPRSQVQIPPEVAAHIRQLYQSRNPANIQQADALYQQYAKPREEVKQLVSPQDRARAGLDPNDTTRYQQDASGKISPINPQPFQVNVNQQQESEFRKEAGKLTAKRFDDIIQQGRQSQEMIGNVNMLRELGTQFQSGKIAEFKGMLGPYAEALGIPVKDLASIQTYDSLVQRVAPSLRVPGSGAQSDFELRAFLKSLPGVGNTPQGNEMISNTLQALSEHRIAAAEIASDAMTGEITQREAEKRIRELKDPLTLWKEFKNTSPVSPQGAPRSAAGEQGGQPSIQDAVEELRRRGLVR